MPQVVATAKCAPKFWGCSMVNLVELLGAPFETDKTPIPASSDLFWDEPSEGQKLLLEFQGARSAYERKQIMARIQKEKDGSDFSEYVLPRPSLKNAALHGILGEMVEAACANSEAVPTSVAIHILGRFAATLGRTAYIQIGDEQRHLRMFALIVGPTAKGRKGTSSQMPRKLFDMVELNFLQYASWLPLQQLSALATGEGLIHRLRDPHTWSTGDKEHVDPGVADKRLFCDVSEFAGVLAQGRRDGSTLTTVVRDAFDGVPLTIPTKTSFNRASHTHVVIVGSVPETEIVRNLNEVDKTNGFANRFPMFYSARDKIVPSPKPTDEKLIRKFAEHLAWAIWEGSQLGEVPMSTEARGYWEGELYGEIENADYPPNVSSLLARRTTHTLIFAALLALLNRGKVIELKHLEAANAWMDYWAETVLFVFSSGEQNEQAIKDKSLRDELVTTIGSLGGRKVSHTDLVKKVTNKHQRKDLNSKQVKDAMEALQRESPARIISTTVTTVGRPATYYTLVELRDASESV